MTSIAFVVRRPGSLSGISPPRVQALECNTALEASPFKFGVLRAVGDLAASRPNLLACAAHIDAPPFRVFAACVLSVVSGLNAQLAPKTCPVGVQLRFP